jgi:uncharacterized membrane protein
MFAIRAQLALIAIATAGKFATDRFPSVRLRESSPLVHPYELLLLVIVGLNIWADFMDRRAAIQSDANALTLWTVIVQFIFVAPLLVLTTRLTAEQTALCAGVGAFTGFARSAWYRALSMREGKLSRLAPFARLSSVMVLVLACTLLGEACSILKFSGAMLMVAGALAISLDRSFSSFRDYLASNRAILLVLIFAASMAAISVFYKYMLNAGVSIISTYVFLKLSQCAALIGQAYRRGFLQGSFSAIADVPLFMQARAMQTIAALLYLFVLSHVDLSTVEPIAAAASPLLYLLIDKIAEWRMEAAKAREPGAPRTHKQTRRKYAAYFGSGATAIGLYFVVRS